jgi:hypothetical protein
LLGYAENHEHMKITVSGTRIKIGTSQEDARIVTTNPDVD